MSIRLSSLCKSFGDHLALDHVSVEIETGEFFVVLGPSGCGKSTLLRCIAGLEAIDSGEIALGGQMMAGPRTFVPPERRNVGVVFQSYALWPHMSVEQNVAFPLETAGLARSETADQTAACLEMVELAPLAKRRPADLSGGQRQRVALARCLAQSARTILMDEPLANLDPHLRSAMEEELAEFHRKSGSTTIFITHDQREAMALADRIALMKDGKLLQVDAPDKLYSRPASEMAAQFIGRSTIVNATAMQVQNGRARVHWADQPIDVACPSSTRPGPVRLMIRPEHLKPADDGALASIVQRATYRGGYWEAHVRIERTSEEVLVNLATRAGSGDELHLFLDGGWVVPADGPL
ncbi:ABC transporter [Roseibium aquae]|uniref:ABC transporter n=1 Tax=Roseibium aquae TaxID=1323746 RepID=A0A916WVH0_9HYPH|nr:ABC transporter ATP-binding protein [Roseibium aquae]GGB33272.1 ABC transporter [Roseibium aquae]